MKRKLKVSIIISILFVLLIRLRPIWVRYPGGIWNGLFFLVITILFFWLLIKILIEIVNLIRQRKNLNLKLFVPIALMTVSLLDGIYNPLSINLDKIYGKVNFRACYEGTQNQATFVLRDNGKFDIHWTGVFFFDDYFTGEYVKKGDTLLLNFKTEVPQNLSDTLVIDGDYIYSLKKDKLVPTYFYLGLCKGLN